MATSPDIPAPTTQTSMDVAMVTVPPALLYDSSHPIGERCIIVLQEASVWHARGQRSGGISCRQTRRHCVSGIPMLMLYVTPAFTWLFTFIPRTSFMELDARACRQAATKP